MQGTVVGTVVKSGSSQYGFWCLVAEPRVKTKNGKEFEPKVMCNVDAQPPVDGTPILVTGTVMAKAEEYNGNWNAKLTLSFGRFTVLGSQGEPDYAKPDMLADVPFHHQPYDTLDTTRDGHCRW